MGAACGTIVARRGRRRGVMAAPVGSLMTVPAISGSFGFEAVHEGHLRERDARGGGEAAERVAGPHRVGAHRLGRARRGGRGGRVAAGALPGAGSLRLVAWMTQESSSSPLAAASALSETPLRAAIALSESPGWTR